MRESLFQESLDGLVRHGAPVCPEFFFRESSDSQLEVFVKLGEITAKRESWDIPRDYFFAGSKLCKNKIVAAKVLLRQFLNQSC